MTLYLKTENGFNYMTFIYGPAKHTWTPFLLHYYWIFLQI